MSRWADTATSRTRRSRAAVPNDDVERICPPLSFAVAILTIFRQLSTGDAAGFFSFFSVGTTRVEGVMAERYDAVVVGAGPAGSTAARELAARSARVLLVDRAAFPRDKPCGGGVWLSAAVNLPFSLASVTERVVTGFRVSCGRWSPISHYSRAPLALMTRRAHLDEFLVGKAVAAGARFADARPVAAVESHATGARVRFRDGSEVSSRAVIGADGVNGATRRSLGLGQLANLVALEANVPMVPDRWAEQVGLDIGLLRGGYGWVFPKGDHCNLGVGGRPHPAARLRAALNSYSAREGFDPSSMTDLKGYLLPLRAPGSPAWSGNVVLVGDAAGLVDPLSGEGIGNAIRSGMLAARHVVELLAGHVRDLAGYQRSLERDIDPELQLAQALFSVLHRWPGVCVGSVRSSNRIQESLCRIVRGERTYGSLMRPLDILLRGLRALRR